MPLAIALVPNTERGGQEVLDKCLWPEGTEEVKGGRRDSGVERVGMEGGREGRRGGREGGGGRTEGREEGGRGEGRKEGGEKGAGEGRGSIRFRNSPIILSFTKSGGRCSRTGGEQDGFGPHGGFRSCGPPGGSF